jgi:hypothetical protein
LACGQNWTPKKNGTWKTGWFIDEDIKKMTELLRKRGSVSTQHWFYTPDCCQVAADIFLHPIHFHTSSSAIPLEKVLLLFFLENWMDNLRSNLTRIWTYVISIEWYPKRLVSLDEFTFFVRTTPISRFFKTYCCVHGPIRHPNVCVICKKMSSSHFYARILLHVVLGSVWHEWSLLCSRIDMDPIWSKLDKFTSRHTGKFL